ncbi:hypothetical protein EPR50_G00068040, partial [Perca flavescens]
LLLFIPARGPDSGSASTPRSSPAVYSSACQLDHRNRPRIRIHGQNFQHFQTQPPFLKPSQPVECHSGEGRQGVGVLRGEKSLVLSQISAFLGEISLFCSC